MSIYEEAIQKEIALNPDSGTLEYVLIDGKHVCILSAGFHNCPACDVLHNGKESGRIGLLRVYLAEVVKQRDVLRKDRDRVRGDIEEAFSEYEDNALKREVLSILSGESVTPSPLPERQVTPTLEWKDTLVNGEVFVSLCLSETNRWWATKHFTNGRFHLHIGDAFVGGYMDTMDECKVLAQRLEDVTKGDA